jgi:hypothetical protein
LLFIRINFGDKIIYSHLFDSIRKSSHFFPSILRLQRAVRCDRPLYAYGSEELFPLTISKQNGYEKQHMNSVLQCATLQIDRTCRHLLVSSRLTSTSCVGYEVWSNTARRRFCWSMITAGRRMKTPSTQQSENVTKSGQDYV